MVIGRDRNTHTWTTGVAANYLAIFPLILLRQLILLHTRYLAKQKSTVLHLIDATKKSQRYFFIVFLMAIFPM